MASHLPAPPSVRQKPWIWTTVILGYALATSLGAMAWHMWPAQSPIHVISNAASWTDEGHWRVETRVRVDAECQVAVTRRFNQDGNFIRPPVASYLDPARPGNLPYLVTARQGTALVWYEYEPAHVPDTYLIEVRAWECGNGFSGVVGNWAVDVARR